MNQRENSEMAAVTPKGVDGRLSLAECRDLLPPDCEVENQQLEGVRDELYALAEVIVEAGGHSLPGTRSTR
jgi:hypothetical protein